MLGGISPIDPNFIKLMISYGALDDLDAVGVHGFPLDWNRWKIDEWPNKIREVENVCPLPVWVTEVGASSFGADEVQVFGIKRMSDLLIGRVAHIFWYSLLDLPPTWEATTRHKESEGSAYYRHFYLGLVTAGGHPKPAFEHFDSRMGVCQWFHFQDHRLDFAVDLLKSLGVRELRTGLSWADWHRDGRGRVVRPPDGPAQGLRRDTDALLHAAVQGPTALLHFAAGGPGGVCPLFRRGDPAVRTGFAASGSRKGRKESL